MSLQTAIVAAVRDDFARAKISLPVSVLEVATDASGGVALKVERGPTDYGYNKSELTENATLTFYVVARDISLLETVLDSLYGEWEQFTGNLTQGTSTYRIRECLLSGEGKGGSEAASQRYEASQTYAMMYNSV